MPENNGKPKNPPEAYPHPDLIRERLIGTAEKLFPKLPELMNAMGKENMMVKMAITSFRPFLPRLEQELTMAIENASDEKMFQLVDFVEGVYLWLNGETENHS